MILAAALALVLVLVIVVWVAPFGRRGVVRAWERELGPVGEDYLAGRPERPDDEGARRLAHLAGELGIDLGSDGGSTGDHMAYEIRRPIERFLDSVLAAGGRPIPSPPPGAESWLSTQRPLIDEIAEHVLAEDHEWSLEDPRVDHEASPGLLGWLSLHRVLLAEAATALAAGSRERADRFLQAAWALNRRLERRPRLMHKVFWLVSLRDELALVRRVEETERTEAWIRGLDGLDPRRELAEGYRAEAALWIGMTSDQELAALDAVFARRLTHGIPGFRDGWMENFWDNPLTDAWCLQRLTFSMRDAAEFHREALESDPCRQTLTPRQQKILQSYPDHACVWPGLVSNAWDRADRLAVDLEMTRQILRARLLMADVGRDCGRLERSLGPSAVCLAGVYRAVPAGASDCRISLEKARPPDFGSKPGLGLQYLVRRTGGSEENPPESSR